MAKGPARYGAASPQVLSCAHSSPLFTRTARRNSAGDAISWIPSCLSTDCSVWATSPASADQGKRKVHLSCFIPYVNMLRLISGDLVPQIPCTVVRRDQPRQQMQAKVTCIGTGVHAHFEISYHRSYPQMSRAAGACSCWRREVCMSHSGTPQSSSRRARPTNSCATVYPL